MIKCRFKYAILPSLPLLTLLLSACLESTQSTYEYDKISYQYKSEVNEEQQPAFNEAFREWESAVGIEFVEFVEGENATIQISIGELPEGFLGMARYVFDSEPILDRYESVESLRTAWITLSPALWEMDAGVQKIFIIHELGHIFTKSPHSDPCPSTMHAQPINCGTTYVDPASAEIASRNIDNGWLDRQKNVN